MHWKRDFSKCEITNRVGLNCEVGVCKIRSSAAWVFAWLRVSMRDDKRKMGPSFTGHPAWLGTVGAGEAPAAEAPSGLILVVLILR